MNVELVLYGCTGVNAPPLLLTLNWYWYPDGGVGSPPVVEPAQADVKVTWVPAVVAPAGVPALRVRLVGGVAEVLTT